MAQRNPGRQRRFSPEISERIRRDLNTPLKEDSPLWRALFGRPEPEPEPEIEVDTRSFYSSKADVEEYYRRKGMDFSQDFEIFYVQKADREGLGPGLSTRVKSHQFFPHRDWDSIYSTLRFSSAQLYPSRLNGAMHVTWHKQSKNHTYTVYDGINLELYRGFYNSNSKGRAVKDFENNFYNV